MILIYEQIGFALLSYEAFNVKLYNKQCSSCVIQLNIKAKCNTKVGTNISSNVQRFLMS